MQIIVNNEPHIVQTNTLAEIIHELGYGTARIATALNGDFVPASQRKHKIVEEGGVVEILAPMQGG
ncbi:sulfur carrier protein ThiS [Swingsia samuiensis]|uniref:Sulfur carrier protein ThiS n=1 Tax=Swingsia samuiensis TaxID=1293412 RepID=A0A4Y6UIE2_9PROT|nr:sulfur carrier protein ThiS [Swingsia samuiensis]QDH16141.1 sulfur carrier protein ThiS [Swingsia samuiensis]